MGLRKELFQVLDAKPTAAMADLELNLLALICLRDSKASEPVQTEVHRHAVWERPKYKLKHIFLAARSTV